MTRGRTWQLCDPDLGGCGTRWKLLTRPRPDGHEEGYALVIVGGLYPRHQEPW